MFTKKVVHPIIAKMKLERKSRRKSQLDVARALGVTPACVHLWEVGKTIPARRNIARIEAWIQGKNYVEGKIKLGGFARKVKKMRLSRWLTFSEMSRQSGISVTNLYNWENGIYEPSELFREQLREWENDYPLIKE